MDEDIKTSYSAAGEIPLKVILNDNIRNSLQNGGMIPMTHIQLIPTNKCNLNCPWCSCSNRDKTQELSAGQIYDVMSDAKDCGCEACSITGGGEPLLHPEINRIISDIHMLGIEVGVVTNGTQFDKLLPETYDYITWIRISSGDHRDFPKAYYDSLKKVVERGAEVDWGFSHVVSAKPNFKTIACVVDFANEFDFTHVRLVPDLLDLDNVSMDGVKAILHTRGIDDSLVNYQDRQSFTHGRKECLISLLKPVVDAEGYITPCCGSQYALANPSLDFEKTMRMGEVGELKRIYLQQENFDGSKCVKCYYDHYNTLLASMRKTIKHKKFA